MAFRFSLISYILLLPIFSIVNGFPETRRDGTIVLGPANGTAAGSAYFMTNDPAGNYIITTDVHLDGTLTPRFAIPTGGKGGHGIQTVPGPNPLFSDGSVRGHGSTTVRAVITINAGSNSMTLFRIDPTKPSEIIQVGDPIDTAGDFPVSVAYNAVGNIACVVNAGKRSGIACFNVDTSTGFTPIPDTIRSVDLGQTTPPHGPANTPGHIIFSEGDNQLVASFRGDPANPKNNPGMLAVWNITSTGVLSKNFTKVLPPPGALEPSSMTRLLGTPTFMVTDPFVGASVYDVAINDTAAIKSVPIPGQKFTSWSLFSNHTRNFYLTDIDANIITELNITYPAHETTIVNQYPLDPGAAPEDLTVSTLAGQDYLYVLEAGKLSVKAFIIKGAGDVAPIQEVAYGPLAKKAGLNLDTNNVIGLSLLVSPAT